MKVKLVIRDNLSERSVELEAEMPPRDLAFLNEAGEQIAQGTEWQICVVAYEDRA